MSRPHRSAGTRTGPTKTLAGRRVGVRTRDPAQKRARIMGAARRLFAERGFGATSTAAVASHAGVSEGIVFHHFGSKAGLLEAVAADYGRGLAQAMFEAAPLPGTAPSATAMLQSAFTYVRKHGALARLLGLSAEPSESSAARRASRAEIVGALARGFEAWAQSGLLRPMDAQIVAELLFALVEAALMECFVRGDGSREAIYLREAVRCVEGAVLPLPTDPYPTRSPS
ncbi:MAG TPA: TetR/AcrR family transcriptional regulator [Myxococcota bacterium]|nr:TetR/AcrR family transcriptional regulator [Myxococcota bacterium]